MPTSIANKSPYINGIFSPVTEEATITDMEVIGEIPKNIHGMFVRNGPNPRFNPKGRYHWFDGDAMIHSVELKDGKATYRNRYIRTLDFEDENGKGEAVWPGILERMPERTDGHLDKNTANTDLIWFGDKLLATWWLGGDAYHIQVPDLKTVGVEDFGGTFSGKMAAHPKVDPRNGELRFFNFEIYKPPYMQYGVVGADGKLKHFVDIDIPGPRLLHDIAITENYTILMDLPLVWNQERLKKRKRLTMFDESLPTRFGIIPKYGTPDSIRWFEVPACYIFHTINAFEHETPSGTEIILSACRIDNPVAQSLRERTGKIPRIEVLELKPFLYEWRFNLKTGNTVETQKDDQYTEFPRMNDKFMSYAAKYGYSPSIAEEKQLLFDGFYKYDLGSGASLKHSYGADRFGGEVVFIPDPDSKDEDGGYLGTFVYDRKEDTAEFVLVSAKDPDRPPVARIKVPKKVPIGFHAEWVALN